MKNIVIFASGGGTNAENIIKYFKENRTADVKCVLTNNPNAGVIERAKSLGIDVKIFNRDEFYTSDEVLETLGNYDTDIVVLAGFLWLVPENILNNYNDRIINIHPALLPKYGGKGMYGMRVHEAVIDANEDESGITIHKVNKRYDEGQVIFQAKVKIDNNETPYSLAEKIHLLEYEHFPKVINDLLA